MSWAPQTPPHSMWSFIIIVLYRQSVSPQQSWNIDHFIVDIRLDFLWCVRGSGKLKSPFSAVSGLVLYGAFYDSVCCDKESVEFSEEFKLNRPQYSVVNSGD